MEGKDCPSGDYFVHREILDELRLDEVAKKGTWSIEPTLAEQVKESLRCSVPRLKKTVLSWVPVLEWLPKYSIRENVIGDLSAGCSVGIMHLPQGMAYALLASLRPVFGLYTSFYPMLIYFIFGTSRHISIGTFAVISIMVGSVTESLAPDSNFILNGTNSSVDIDARDASRVQIACSLTVLTGIIQILLGLIRFGFVVTYLSEPLIRGYTTAAACHVCVSQLKYLFGVTPSRFSGPFSIIYTVVDICRLLPQTQVPELVVSLVSLIILFVAKEINGCYKKKLPIPIPLELIVIIAATLIIHFCGLRTKYSIDVVGIIPTGLNTPQVPQARWFSEMIGNAFAVAIVGYAINISLGKTFALKYGYKVDSNQELVALGLSNTVGSFFQCYSVTCSLSRSLIQESTGGKTQVAGVISSVIVLIAVLKIGALFEDLPKAVLATIVFVNLKGMFTQFMDVPMLWKTNKVDLLVWLVTFLCTILFNLDLGLALSVGFSMLTVIFRTQRPRYSILGHVPSTELYLDTKNYREAKEIPGIKIFRSSATIYYTNAEIYLEALQEKSGIDIGKLLMAKKKRNKKLKHKQDKEKKKESAEKKAARHLTNGTNYSPKLEKHEEKSSERLSGHSQVNGAAICLQETFANGLSEGNINWAYQHDITMLDSDSETGLPCDYSINQVSHHGDEEKGRTSGADSHSIILDISTTSFVDTIFRDFGEVAVDIYLAGCQACVVEQLERAGFFSETIPKTKLFVSVHDAVIHILKKKQQMDVIPDMSCNTQM